MMEQTIEIRARPYVVYAIAQDVARWPRLLPHYDDVRILREDGDERIALMAARRDWIPVRWTAMQRLLPAIPRIEFTHLSGWARGMRVAWIFDTIEQGTLVTIAHDLATLRVPIVRSAWGKALIARQFIAPIARRTLATMKQIVEETGGN